jgi:hypothetical protein
MAGGAGVEGTFKKNRPWGDFLIENYNAGRPLIKFKAGSTQYLLTFCRRLKAKLG